jgi:hypothetical protein
MQTKLAPLGLACLVAAVVAVCAAPARAAVSRGCPEQTSTPASYTWNFKAEANQIFQSVAQDAAAVLDHADKLDAFSRQPGVSWQSHGTELNAIRAQVDDMGAKLGRLETIRRVLAPWQQQEVDQIARRVQLLADNTEDAIHHLNEHQNQLWAPNYQMNTRNLYDEADKLTHSVDTAVAFAKASHEYQTLGNELGVKGSD